MVINDHSYIRIHKILSELAARKKSILKKIEKQIKELTNEKDKTHILNELEKLIGSLLNQINREEAILENIKNSGKEEIIKTLPKSIESYLTYIEEQKKLIKDFKLEIEHIKKFVKDDPFLMILQSDNKEKIQFQTISQDFISKFHEYFNMEKKLQEESKEIIQDNENIISEFDRDHKEIKKILGEIAYLQDYAYNKSNDLRFRCGFPREDFFDKYIQIINNLQARIYNLLLKFENNALTKTNAKIKEVCGQARYYSDHMKYLIGILKKYNELTEKMLHLSSNPLQNRNAILNCWKEFDVLKQETLSKMQGIKSFIKSEFMSHFLFTRIKPITWGYVYHGISFCKGVSVEGVIRRGNIMNPKDYAQSIVNVLDNGINLSVSDNEYNSCSVFPAVYFYRNIGLWNSFAYIKLNCNNYPVFEATKEWSAYYSTRGPEQMIYTQKALPLVNYELVFHHRKFVIPKKIAVNSEHYIDLTIASLPDISPKGNKIIFNYKGKDWTPSEYIHERKKISFL